jgi:hypothetical protein
MRDTLRRWIPAFRHRGPGYDLAPLKSAVVPRAVTLTLLADQWERLANSLDTAADHSTDSGVIEILRYRAQVWRTAARDLGDVLVTGILPSQAGDNGAAEERAL